MNEIVKYQNDMNRLNFKGFTQTDMNMFMALCTQMKEKSTEEINMSFSKIKELVKYDVKKKNIEEFVNDLQRMNENLMKVNCKIITGSKIKMFVLFPTFEIDTEKETLKVAVNKEFTWLLNEMKSYTTFELAEFIELKSKYSKNLYRLLKQWRTTGKYVFHNLEEFRELMDVPKTYSNKYMMERCVDVAIEEISKSDGSFKGFKCEPVYARKRGKPLDKLIFTWQAEKPEYVPREEIDGQMSLEFDDKPSPVALKIARDIEKGRKNPKKSGNSGFHNFDGRTYTDEEMKKLEKQLLGWDGDTDEE